MLNEEKKGYIGNPAQLALVRRVTVAEGKAKGTGIIEVRTAGGLELDILPDSDEKDYLSEIAGFTARREK